MKHLLNLETVGSSIKWFAGIAALLLGIVVAPAANVYWNGGTSADFEEPGNWVGGVTPINDLYTDTAVLDAATATNQPALTISRSVKILNFAGTNGGMTLGSASGANHLTLGPAGGILCTAQTGGTNTVSANLDLAGLAGVSQFLPVRVGTGGNLLLTGAFTNTAATTLGGGSIYINQLTNTIWGNVILSPAAGKNVNLSGLCGQSVFQVKGGGCLMLGGDGTNAPLTTSVNHITNDTVGNATWGILAPGKVQVNSGTWICGDLGKNGADAFTGTLEVNGGLFSLAGMRYSGTATINVNGGTLKLANNTPMSNGGQFSLGLPPTGYVITNVAVLNLTGGLLDLAVAQGSAGGNGIGYVVSALFNQTGGTFQNAVNPGGVGTTTTFKIGANGVNENSLSAVTLTGGTFISAGTVQYGGSTGFNNINNFNFMGGILAIGSMNTTGLGSSPTATATNNQTATSENIGTLVNYGGTIAPGNTNKAGKTLIYGNCAIQNGVVAIDIGGTNAATTYQTNVAGFYDVFQVTTNLTLGGSLQVNFIDGFTPTSSNQFTCIYINSSSGGLLSGTFNNLLPGGSLGRVAVANYPNATFSVRTNTQNTAVYLTDFQVVPTAGFSGTPTSGAAPLTVTFTNTSTGTATNYVWTFGDGETNSTTALSVSHTYAGSGTYSVTLEAFSSAGNSLAISNNYIVVGSASSPSWSVISVAGGSLILQGTNGPTSGDYWLRSSTNVTLPVARWPVVATNAFLPNGTFSNSVPILPGESRRFYQIEIP